MISTWGDICRSDGTISHAQLVKLVRTLAPPIGTGPTASPHEAEEYIERISIVRVLKNRFTFAHTAWGLLAATAEVPVPDNNATAICTRRIGKHFVTVYTKLGIFGDGLHKSSSKKCWGVLPCIRRCGWLPCMRRRADTDSMSETRPSRMSGWSIFPSFTGSSPGAAS
jgi:hypothetical protein